MNKILEQLKEYENNGLLRSAVKDNLIQYTYTRECEFENAWDDITKSNRSRVYDMNTGKIVATSFYKFFNFSQSPAPLQEYILKTWKDIIVSKKYDGCLGLIYYYNNELRVNSKCSFDSFAVAAAWDIIEKQNLKNKMIEFFKQNPNTTLVVEIIHKDTKILLDYDKENLYLLSIFNNEDNTEYGWREVETKANEIGIPFAEKYTMTFDELFEWQNNHDWTEEGFVVAHYLPMNGYYITQRIKIKSLDYLRVAAMRQKLTPIHIWKCMLEGLDIREIIEGLDDEFIEKALGIYNSIRQNAEQLAQDIIDEVAGFPKEPKELGLYFATNPYRYSSIAFKIIKGQLKEKEEVVEEVIKYVKPEVKEE